MLLKLAALCWAIAHIVGFVMAALFIAGVIAFICYEVYDSRRRSKK